jgi:hypothetical protein
MWAILTAYGAMGILPLLILERPAYLRERADGLYRPITYLVRGGTAAGALNRRFRSRWLPAALACSCLLCQLESLPRRGRSFSKCPAAARTCWAALEGNSACVPHPGMQPPALTRTG